MYLDFKKINAADKKQPMLRLQTLAGKELGVIPFAYDVHFEINYADISTIEFTVPYYANGIKNPLYNELISYRVVYTEEFGIYVLTSPKKSGDGITEIKTVTGYSLEQMLSTKSMFLEEGTYNFWNPLKSGDTVLGRIIEADPSWHVGYVSPRLIGCYRTFDEYSDDILSFCYGDAAEKYRCAFVFDVYQRSISVYDLSEEVPCVPVYLDYKNLVDAVDVSEITDDLTTKLHLYGSDDLSIREVNPTGTDYIINLDYFIANGDLDVFVGSSSVTLAQRVKDWEQRIRDRQQYYVGLISARASLTAQKLSEQAALVELNGELDTLMTQQNVTIQAYAIETTDTGKSNRLKELANIYAQVILKRSEISRQEAAIDSIQNNIDQYTSSIQSVNRELSYNTYFTAQERDILDRFLIEGELEDETFVATDVSSSNEGTVGTVSGTVSFTSSAVTRVTDSRSGNTMYLMSGGELTVPGGNFSGNVVRGTLDMRSGSSYVLSVYLGDSNYGGKYYSSGLLTLTGSLSSLSSDVSLHVDQGIQEYTGTRLSFYTSGASSYFTAEASDFQRYSVSMDLYEFGVEALDDCAWPSYEFDIDSANFLYQEKFEPFKDSLTLGKGVHLNLGSEGNMTAKVIGVELDFDDIRDFKLLFSNRYYRKTGVTKWIDDIKKTSRSSRSFDASKFIYNRSADMSTDVDEFMKGQLNAAVNNIVNKTDQTVLINSAGIQVGGNSNYQLRIVDNMLAMTDDGWQSAKLAIGLFASPETGEQWGVNAELIAGKLIIGNNLVLQNPLVDSQGHRTGTMMFQVDATGVWLYNSRMVFQSNSGRIIIDPEYGIAAGNNLLFSTSGTTVTPGFIDRYGRIITDSDGMPQNANFYLDIDTGNAYFRGKLIAESGEIGGFTIASSYLYSGSSSNRVAINGGSTYNSNYAFWAGSETPSLAPFYVMKNGTVKATNGTFEGKVTATSGSFTGTITAKDGTIGGLTIKDGYLYSGSGQNHIEINSSSSHYSAYAFWAGADSPTSAPFWVKKNGEMSATNGTFNGKVTATSGSFSGTITAKDGTIGGLTIKDGYMYSSNGSKQYVGVSGGYGDGEYVFWAGNSTPASAPFWVKKDGSMKATSGTFTGSISFDDFNKDAQQKVNQAIEDALAAIDSASAANDAAVAAKKTADGAVKTAGDASSLVSGWTYSGTTYIDGNKIFAGTVAASKLVGGEVDLLGVTYDWRGNQTTYVVGKILIGATADGAGIEFTSTGGFRVECDGNFWVKSSSGSFGIGSSTAGAAFTCGANLIPQGSSYTIGTKNNPWNAVYASTGEIQSSDANLKNNIEDLSDKYIDLIDHVKPVRYKLNDGTSGRYHTGFISQQVESAMNTAGVNSKEFGGFVKDTNDEGEEIYMLRYEEFIALLLAKIRQQERRIKQLEDRA